MRICWMKLIGRESHFCILVRRMSKNWLLKIITGRGQFDYKMLSTGRTNSKAVGPCRKPPVLRAYSASKGTNYLELRLMGQNSLHTNLLLSLNSLLTKTVYATFSTQEYSTLSYGNRHIFRCLVQRTNFTAGELLRRARHVFTLKVWIYSNSTQFIVYFFLHKHTVIYLPTLNWFGRSCFCFIPCSQSERLGARHRGDLCRAPWPLGDAPPGAVWGDAQRSRNIVRLRPWATGQRWCPKLHAPRWGIRLCNCMLVGLEWNSFGRGFEFGITSTF